MKLEDLVDFNPRTPVAKGESAPFVEMATLPTGDKHFPISAFRVFKGSGSKFKDGDTLIARITPCLENGKGGFVKGLGESVFAHGSTEFIVLRAKKPSDKEFTYYVTKHPDFRAFTIKQMSGTSGRQRVSWQSLTGYDLFNLQPEEREAIGNLLSTLDDKIELNRRMNGTLEAMARAVFRDWFVDFGPTRRKAAMKYKGAETDPVAILGLLLPDPTRATPLAALFPASLGDNGLPEGWEERAIYDFAKVVYGAPFKSKQFNSEKRGRPLARIRDLPKHEGGNYTEEVHPREHLIEPGDIVVGMDGEFRAYVWQGKSTLMNQRVCSFVAHNKANRAFVWLGIQPQLFANENSAIGTTVIHLGKGDIDRFQLLSTNSDILLEFSKLVEPMIDLIVVNGQENQTLAATRDLLIPKLMSGEIRLKDAG